MTCRLRPVAMPTFSFFVCFHPPPPPLQFAGCSSQTGPQNSDFIRFCAVSPQKSPKFFGDLGRGGGGETAPHRGRPRFPTKASNCRTSFYVTFQLYSLHSRVPTGKKASWCSQGSTFRNASLLVTF